MRTLVIQSYRTKHVEPWMKQCMQTVREWAILRGYDYEFVDDTLFNFAPGAMCDDLRIPLLPKTDAARLGLLDDRLKTHDRAIWLDADVLIFDQEAFTVPERCGAMFCHEVWTSLDEGGELRHQRGINNALMIFERGHPLLGFLRYATSELYLHCDPARFSTLALGTALLGKLGQMIPLRLHTQIACMSPMLLAAAFYQDHPEWLLEHARKHGDRFFAVNLCRSLITAPFTRQRWKALNAEQMLALIERLIATRGEALLIT